LLPRLLGVCCLGFSGSTRSRPCGLFPRQKPPCLGRAATLPHSAGLEPSIGHRGGSRGQFRWPPARAPRSWARRLKPTELHVQVPERAAQPVVGLPARSRADGGPSAVAGRYTHEHPTWAPNGRCRSSSRPICTVQTHRAASSCAMTGRLIKGKRGAAGSYGGAGGSERGDLLEA